MANFLGIDTKKVADGALLGSGLLLGMILLSGLIKTTEKVTGGIIPDEFTRVDAFYGTGNTLSPSPDGSYWI